MRTPTAIVCVAALAAPFLSPNPLPSVIAATEAELVALTTQVGTLPGAVTVDQTGDAGYHLPFAVPRGPGGHTPAIGLAYHSSVGNGLLGVGWTVSGMSAIEKCPREARVNGERSPYQWFQSEAVDYCLDGERLYRVATPSPRPGRGYYPDSFDVQGDGTYEEYRTRTNPSQQILFNTTNHVWLVAHPDRRHRVYQAGGPPRRDPAPRNTSRRGPWMLSEDWDGYDNSIKYSYGETHGEFQYEAEAAEDLPGGRPRVEQIEYGANAIRFRYIDRPEPVRGFRDAVGANVSSLVAQVDVYNDDTLVRAYKLFYDQGTSTQRSRLTSVKMCHGVQANEADWADLFAEVCVPPTKFEYTDKERGFEDVAHPSLPAPSAAYDGPIRVADFNGDGRDDVAIVVGTEDKLRINVAFGGLGGLGSAKPSVSSSGNLFADSHSQGFMTVCDPNGNGRDDLIIQTAPDRFTVLAGHANLTGSTYYWSAFSTHAANAGDKITFAACSDFDGNGFDDVVTCEGTSEQDNYYVMYASNGSTLTRTRTNLFCRTIGKQVIDATDDGVPDIVDLGFSYPCNVDAPAEYEERCHLSGFYTHAAATKVGCVRSMLPCPCSYDSSIFDALSPSTFTCADGTVCPLGSFTTDARYDPIKKECISNTAGKSRIILTAGGVPGGPLRYWGGGIGDAALGKLVEGGGWEYTTASLGAADLNGDGMVDPLIFRIKEESELWTAFGTGGAGIWPGTELDAFNEYNADNFALADWDSDGRTDMLVQTGDPTSDNLMALTWSLDGSGQNSADASYAAIEDTGVPHIGRPNVGDFNGDGMVDILMCEGCTAGETPTSQWSLYYNEPTFTRAGDPMRAPPDYLAEIEDGFGAIERIAYRAFADDSAAQLHCTDNFHCTCPAQTRCELPRKPVVASYEVVGVSTQTYSYRGALSDRLTGRSLGVTEHEVRRERGTSDDWVVLTEFRNAEYDATLAAFPYAGLPWRTTAHQGAGPETSRHFYTQTVSEPLLLRTTPLAPANLVAAATSAYFVWPHHVLTETYERDTPVSDVDHLSWGEPLTHSDYREYRDLYGNVTDTVLEDDVGGAITTIRYDHDATHWLVARQREVVVVAGSSGDTRDRRVRFVYEPKQPRPSTAIHEEDEPKLAYTVRYTYDDHGNVNSVEKSALLMQRESTATWDACDGAFPSSRVNAMGHPVTMVWDCAHGVMTRSSDANTIGWTTHLDGFGRPIRRVEQDAFGVGSGTDVTIKYERAGPGANAFPSPLRVRRRSAAGTNEWLEADEHGRAIQAGRIVAGETSLRDITYDALGRATSRTEPYWDDQGPGPSWLTTYDNRDRVVRVNGPEGFALDYDYEELTRTRTDADGRVHEVVVDGRGRTIRAVKAPGTGDESSVCYRYGGFDQLMRVSLDCDATEAVEIRDFEWDVGAYRVTEVQDEVGGTTVTQYNNFGEPWLSIDGAGRQTRLDYNDLGQVISLERWDADGHPESAAEWQYTGIAEPWFGPPGSVKLSQIWSDGDWGSLPGVTRDSRWDTYGRPKKQTLTVDGEAVSTSWAYDAVGRLHTMEIDAGDELAPFEIGYGYDPSGDLLGVLRTDTLSALWTRQTVDAAGQTTKDLFGNGVERRTRFDDMGRVELLQSSPQPWPALAFWTPSLLQTSDGYEYTPAGQLDRHTDHDTEQYERYDYDLAGRLDGILTSTLDNSEQSIETFAYDRFNNFAHKNGATVVATPGGRVVSTGTRAYQHDDAGNVIRISYAGEPGLAGGVMDLPVDIERTVGNRMKRVTTPEQSVVYRHDADDSLVETHWEDSGERWLKHGAYTRITAPQQAPKHRYEISLAPGASLVVTRAETIGDWTWTGKNQKPFVETVRYALTDLRGSPQSITNKNGVSVERRSFGNWGTPRDPNDWTAAATLTDFNVPDGFTGMPAKTVSGLVDFGGRWLDSTAGVMLEPDPLVVDPLDPMSQNATMFGPGPLTIDPTGYAESGLVDRGEPNTTPPVGLAFDMGMALGQQIRKFAQRYAHRYERRGPQYSWTGQTPETQMSLAGAAGGGDPDPMGVSFMQGVRGGSGYPTHLQWLAPYAAKGMHTALDVCGMVPGWVGPACDGFNAYLYAYEGDLDNASLSLVSAAAGMVPVKPVAEGHVLMHAGTPTTAKAGIKSQRRGNGFTRRDFERHMARNEAIERVGARPTANKGLDFRDSPYLYPDANKSIQTIDYTGSREWDFKAANAEAGFEKTPEGYIWHHVSDYGVPGKNKGTMQLIHEDAHARIGHNGGVQQWEWDNQMPYQR